jgi:hypothetical protein
MKYQFKLMFVNKKKTLKIITVHYTLLTLDRMSRQIGILDEEQMNYVCTQNVIRALA